MKAKTPVPGKIDLARFVRTDKKHISNSYLSTLKRALIGAPQWFATESFLTFGTEMHKRGLEPKELTVCLDKDDSLCTNMAYSFRNHPKVKQILRGATCEKEVMRVHRGVWILLYLDIYKQPRAWDWKGTSCESEKQFIKKSREFDYFRQSALYIDVCKLKHFEFIGEGKKPIEVEKGYPGSYWIQPHLDIPGKWVTHPIYFLPVMDYPIYLEEGREEANQLIDIHIQLRRYYERA